MDNTPSPSQTATLPPTSAPASQPSSPSIPASETAAVSHAIRQAVPPRPSTGPRQLNPNQPTQQTQQTSTSKAQESDNVISEEDFDEVPSNAKPKQVAKAPVVKSEETKTLEQPEQEDQQQAEEKVDENAKSEESLELDINLEEEIKDLNKPKTPGRDYSRFKPEHAELLKHVPNRVFDKLSVELQKVYSTELENKQLKERLEKSEAGKLPDNYYEHEQAYVLSPTYKQLESDLRYDNHEESHWATQLAKIKRGQPWQLLKGYTEDGRPVYENRPALEVKEDGSPNLDVDSELMVEQYLTAARDQKRQHLLEISGLAKNHQQDYAKSKQGIEQLKSTFFKSFTDESRLTPSIKADIQTAKDALIQSAPAFKGNPLSELLAFSYAALKLQQRQMINMMKAMNQKQEVQQVAARVGPSKTELSGGTNSGADRVLSEKDFEE